MLFSSRTSASLLHCCAAPPHEPTAKGVRVLTHGGRHGIQCPTHALFTSASGGIIIHNTGKPEHVGVYPVPITMPTSGSFFSATSRHCAHVTTNDTAAE